MIRTIATARAHWPFIVVLAVGTAVRVLAWVAYRPALFYADSLNYLANVGKLPGTSWHPPGYPVFLDILLIGNHVSIVTAAQHILVLGDGAVLYVVLRRVGCGRWPATLGTAPLLLDAYQIQIEQYVLAEALFETLLVAAIAVALWSASAQDSSASPEPAARRLGVVALLVSLSALVRLDAVGLVIPLALFVGWSLARTTGPRRLWNPGARRAVAAAAVGFVIPLGVLAGLRAAGGHGASVSGESPIWLYGRVAGFANCAADSIPADERELCPTQPAGERPGPVWFENSARSPMRRYLAANPSGGARVEAFARTVIEHQPVDYGRAVVSGFLTQFRPTRAQTANSPDVRPWLFGQRALPPIVNNDAPVPPSVLNRFHPYHVTVESGIARFLRQYQRFVYLPGPLIALILAAGSVCLLWRRRHPLAPGLLLLLSAGVMVVLVATAGVLFSWRYVLPTLVLYPPAGAIAWRMWRSQ